MCACMCMCLSLICISVTPLYTIQCMKCEMKQMLVPNTANLNMIYGADAVCGYGLYHFWKINSQTVPYHVVAATSCLLRSIKYTLGMHTKMCVRIQVCVCNVSSFVSAVSLQARQNTEVHRGTALLHIKMQNLNIGLINVTFYRAGRSVLEVSNILCGAAPAIQVTHSEQ